MAQRKPPKRLFKNKEVIHTYQHDRETNTSMKHITRDHVDVLQNIEAMVLAHAKEDESIDDRTIDEALGLLRGNKDKIRGASLQVKGICLYVDDIHTRREDVSDAIWLAALRTVQESVRRHSSLMPGEKTYIEFVSQFLE